MAHSISVLLAIVLTVTPMVTFAISEEIEGKIRGIYADDGITLLEASEMADVFFHYAQNNGCGGIGQGKDKGAYWEFETRYGFGGTLGKPIHIYKRSGALLIGSVICAENPLTLLKPITDTQCFEHTL